MTQKPLKVGMIGIGGFGHYRRDRMRECGLFELCAGYARTKETVDRECAEEGCAPVGSYEELLDFPGLEAMIISTGGKFHAEQMIQAMERGLHVFVEKPLCSTLEEVEQIVAAQKKSGVVVGVAHADHTNTNRSLQIKKMIDDGFFGNIATFEMTVAHSGGLEIREGDWRGDPEKNPGGMLFQCGCHSFHELMFYFGPIKRIYSAMRYDVHTTLTADVAQCVVEFESGMIGTLGAYHVTPYRHTLNIFGTKHNLFTDSRCPAYGDPEVNNTQYRRCNEAEPLIPIKLDEGGDACGNMRSFYHAVRNGGTPYPGLLDGARAVAAVFAAEISAKTGKAVDIPKY